MDDNRGSENNNRGLYDNRGFQGRRRNNGFRRGFGRRRRSGPAPRYNNFGDPRLRTDQQFYGPRSQEYQTTQDAAIANVKIPDRSSSLQAFCRHLQADHVQKTLQILKEETRTELSNWMELNKLRHNDLLFLSKDDFHSLNMSEELATLVTTKLRTPEHPDSPRRLSGILDLQLDKWHHYFGMVDAEFRKVKTMDDPSSYNRQLEEISIYLDEIEETAAAALEKCVLRQKSFRKKLSSDAETKASKTSSTKVIGAVKAGFVLTATVIVAWCGVRGFGWMV